MVKGMPKLISRGSLRIFSGLAAGWEYPLAEAPAKGLGRMVFSVPLILPRFHGEQTCKGILQGSWFSGIIPLGELCVNLLVVQKEFRQRSP